MWSDRFSVPGLQQESAAHARFAIVTGASQSIGRSTAISLAKDFNAVVLEARHGDAIKDTAEAVCTSGCVGLGDR